MRWYRWELREYPDRRKRWVVAQTDDHQITKITGGRSPRSKSFRHKVRAELWLNWRRAKDKKMDERRAKRDEYKVIR